MITRCLFLFAWFIGLTVPVGAANYYASPTGGGDGCSPSRPFRIADFWRIAKPGHTLLLLDGKYTGAESMITPPKDLSGTKGAPLTIRALHDGKVTIDGQDKLRPVDLYYNDWFVIEGLNACNSKATVVEVHHSSHCTVRRVCAWDAADANTEVFGTHYHGDYNTFEDCAGWGIARKIFQNSQGGDYTTYRRCLGIWQGCHEVGPKMTFSMFYNSRGVVAENCIALWDGTRMRETHQAMEARTGKPFTDWATGPKEPRTYTNFGVDQPYGCFSMDANRDIGPSKGPYLYGCLAFRLKTQRVVEIPGLFFLLCRQEDGYLENCAAIVEESAKPVRTFYLDGINAKALTAIGGEYPYFANGQVEDVLRATGAKGHTAWAAMFQKTKPTRGAHLYYRYENGKLTDKPLWPWPMNQRIKELTGLDVMATIFGLGISPKAARN